MKSASERQKQRAERARRDIRRIGEQAPKLTESAPGTDMPDEDDAIEIWGRRIGRAIGYMIVIYLIYHLITTYMLAQ